MENLGIGMLQLHRHTYKKVIILTAGDAHLCINLLKIQHQLNTVQPRAN